MRPNFYFATPQKTQKNLCSILCKSRKAKCTIIRSSKLENISLVKYAIEPNEGSEKEILKTFTKKLKEAYQFFRIYPAKGKQKEAKTQELKELVKSLYAGVLWTIKKSYDMFVSSLDPE